MSQFPAPPDGFTQFVSARSHALLRSAWLLTGDSGRAEDLLQSDFVRRGQIIRYGGHGAVEAFDTRCR
jgi:DNA-directed RNA polymerase specialized sigma24 family protein